VKQAILDRQILLKVKYEAH